LWPVLLALLSVSLSRPAGLRSDQAARPDPHQVPFQEGERTAGEAPRDGQLAAQSAEQDSDSSPPFRDSQGLPAGTLLTVRLKSPVSADNTGASKSFDAVVDEPVLIEGSTMLPRGARVAGRVESARASQVKRDRGYVRLTLDSIDLVGQELPIQTASLFVRGYAGEPQAGETQAMEGENSPQIVRLESGRRLTFRLTESVILTGQSAISRR